MRVVMPSNALDADRSAAHGDPLRRSGAVPRAQAPLSRDLWPRRVSRARLRHSLRQGQRSCGRAKTSRVVTYGAVVPRALQAAQKLRARDWESDVELIDLRTLSPYDWEAIATSVQKTSRVIVAHEDMLSWGYGAEIAARIGDELFDYLDAPVRRVAAMDTFVAYQPMLEDVILPQPEDLYPRHERAAEILSSTKGRGNVFLGPQRRFASFGG